MTFTMEQIEGTMWELFLEGADRFMKEEQMLAITAAAIRAGIINTESENQMKGPMLQFGFELGRRLQAAQQLESATK